MLYSDKTPGQTPVLNAGQTILGLYSVLSDVNR
jgi:hypothetical protein